MSIIINGKEFHGNVTIVNGRVIEEDSFEGSKTKKIDETKRKKADGVRNIYITSNIDVRISASETNFVTAHMYGEAVMNGGFKLFVKQILDEIQISVEPEDSANRSIVLGSSIIIKNCNVLNNNRLILDVQIPEKEFEKIFIHTVNSEIDVETSVKARAITATSKNGDINVSARFFHLDIECTNGNVDVNAKAHNDIYANIVSTNGNIDLELTNIGVSDISPYSMNGSIKNRAKREGTYTASGYVSSLNGNIRIH